VTALGRVEPAGTGQPPGPQRRALRTLVAGQVLGGVGVASGIAVGGLLAEEVSGSTAFAGLAQTASVLGAAVLALPMARLMDARGRRPGLVAGYLAGGIGAVLMVTAAVLGVFVLLLAGAVLFGGATAAGLQARYAATDLATPARRSTALSTVVWATTVGAVLGPNLAGPGAALARSLGLPEFSGPLLFSVAAFALGGCVLVVALRPDPLLEARRLRGETGVRPARPSVATSLTVVRGSSYAVLGLVSIASAHTVMVAVMVMTPVHMSHGGAGLQVVGLVISAHVAGMYALSPVVGWLADRVGRVPVLVGAQLVLLCAVALAGTSGAGSSVALTLGLFLLGLGWSGALVAGSTLLSESVSEQARPGVQGTADFVMGICGAAGGALAGVVVGLWGFGLLNALAALLVVPVFLAVTLARGARAPQGARP
jgi:MFS family permease